MPSLSKAAGLHAPLLEGYAAAGAVMNLTDISRMNSSMLVAMMQTADLGEGNNIASGGKLYGARPWAVLVEGDDEFGRHDDIDLARVNPDGQRRFTRWT